MCFEYISTCEVSSKDPSCCKKTLFQARPCENNFVPNHKYQFSEARWKFYHELIHGTAQDHRTIHVYKNEFFRKLLIMMKKTLFQNFVPDPETLFQMGDLLGDHEES